jgi:hypothetical protein
MAGKREKPEDIVAKLRHRSCTASDAPVRWSAGALERWSAGALERWSAGAIDRTLDRKQGR